MSPEPKFNLDTLVWVMKLRTDDLPTIDEFGEDDEAESGSSPGPRVQDENWDSKQNHRAEQHRVDRPIVVRISGQEPETRRTSGNESNRNLKSIKILRKPLKQIRNLLTRGSTASALMTSPRSDLDELN